MSNVCRDPRPSSLSRRLKRANSMRHTNERYPCKSNCRAWTLVIFFERLVTEMTRTMISCCLLQARTFDKFFNLTTSLLWTRLSCCGFDQFTGVVRALAAIHASRPEPLSHRHTLHDVLFPNRNLFSASHQDIKPENILVAGMGGWDCHRREARDCRFLDLVCKKAPP